MKAVKLLFALGTRPEAIKLAPLIKRAQQDPRFEVRVCSTGQHREMLKPIFKIFDIKPDYELDLMRPGQSPTDLTASILTSLRPILRETQPSWVVVQGDTTTVMAASLCAFYEKIRIAHVEAGLRTGDMLSPFPEEFHRRVTGLVADMHFAPTKKSAENLLNEGVKPSQLLVTGNTGIDALLSFKEKLRNEGLLSQLASRFAALNPLKKTILLTLHRRENFGGPLASVFEGVLHLAKRDDVEFVIPLHLNPEVRRTASEILGANAKWIENCGAGNRGESRIWLCEPQDYAHFIYLMDRAHFVVTDSGGVQEEAPSLGKPVLVVRNTTERPEAVQAGTSKLIGANYTRFVYEIDTLLDDEAAFSKMARAHNPFGDGHSSERILNHIAFDSYQHNVSREAVVAGIGLMAEEHA